MKRGQHSDALLSAVMIHYVIHARLLECHQFIRVTSEHRKCHKIRTIASGDSGWRTVVIAEILK